MASNCEKYPLGGIISAIQNAFHATPELVCSGDAVDELRLCFYKDFKVFLFSYKQSSGLMNLLIFLDPSFSNVTLAAYLLLLFDIDILHFSVTID